MSTPAEAVFDKLFKAHPVAYSMMHIIELVSLSEGDALQISTVCAPT